jgi:hypothetical protein
MRQKKQTGDSTFKIKSDQLVDFLKEALKEGNVQRILIKNTKGKVYLDIPVTVGVIGFFVAPMLMAVAALAHIVGVYEVDIIRK